MIEIAGLTILVLLAWGALMVGLLLLKAVLWLALLPLRLLFYAILMPLLPVAAVASVIWALVRLTRTAPAPTRA